MEWGHGGGRGPVVKPYTFQYGGYTLL
jgi:hypothetical protein